MLNPEISISYDIIPPVYDQELLERITTLADEIPFEELGLPAEAFGRELLLYWSLSPPFNEDRPNIAIHIDFADAR